MLNSYDFQGDVISRNPAYAYRVVQGKAYLTDGLRSHSLNVSATFIWEQLNRPQTMDKMVASLAAKYHLSQERAQADAHAIITAFAQAGLVKVNGEDLLAQSKLSAPRYKQRLALADQMMRLWEDTKCKRILIKLTVELTHACNLHCGYCYSPKSLAGLLTTEEVGNLFEQAAEMGTLFLTLTGGEPLTRRDLVEIVARAEALGFWTRIQTGGGLFNMRVIEDLSKFQHLSLSVTLHGADSETHDQFTRVPGSFQQAVMGIRLLAKAGMLVTIKQVVNRHNIHHVPALAELATSLGVRIQRSPLIYPTTIGDVSPLALRLGDEELLGLIHQGYYVPSPDPCGAGTDKLTISPTGDVFPCVFVRTKVGNIRFQRLEEVWHSSTLENIRNEQWFEPPTACRSCALATRCPRCPAIALLEHGDIRGKSQEACRISRLFDRARKQNEYPDLPPSSTSCFSTNRRGDLHPPGSRW